MKCSLCSTGFWLLLISMSLSASSFGAAPDPLVYWSFNNLGDLGHDDSGNGHSLTIPGPATIAPVAIGNAVSFSGYGCGYTYFGSQSRVQGTEPAHPTFPVRRW